MSETEEERKKRLKAKLLYRQKRRAELAKKQREYYKRNREKVLKQRQEYFNRPDIKQKKKAYLAKYHREHRADASRRAKITYCQRRYADDVRGLSDEQILEWHKNHMEGRRIARTTRQAEKTEHKVRLKAVADQARLTASKALQAHRDARLAQLRKSKAEREEAIAAKRLRLKQLGKQRLLLRPKGSSERQTFILGLLQQMIREQGWEDRPWEELSKDEQELLGRRWRKHRAKKREQEILANGTDEEREAIHAKKLKKLADKRASHARHHESAKERQREYYRKNREKISAEGKRKRIEERDSLKAKRRETYLRKKDRILAANRRYRDKKLQDPAQREEFNKYFRELRKRDGGKRRAYERTWRKTKFEEDLQYKLGVQLRKRLNMAIRNRAKAGSAVRELGCSIKFLVAHIESQFAPGMTWENWGIHGWHLEHIYPLAKADLSDPYEFAIVVNWRNLKPMWGKENVAKKDKVTGENIRHFKFIEQCLIRDGAISGSSKKSFRPNGE
jgi:hypothetical protein